MPNSKLKEKHPIRECYHCLTRIVGRLQIIWEIRNPILPYALGVLTAFFGIINLIKNNSGGIGEVISTFQTDFSSVIILLVSIMLIILFIVYTIIDNYRKYATMKEGYKESQFEAEDFDDTMKSIVMSEDYEQSCYMIYGKESTNKQNEWYVMSNKVNVKLYSGIGDGGCKNIDVIYDPKKFRLQNKVLTLKPYSLKRASTNRRVRLFNSPKLRLSTDILINDSSMTGKVTFQKTDYYSNLFTNDISGLIIKEKLSGEADKPFFDGRYLFVNGDLRVKKELLKLCARNGEICERVKTSDVLKTTLKHLDMESPCANIAGGSTFVVTQDGYLILQIQGNGNYQNSGNYAPSGSGAFDIKDYKKSKSKKLYELVVRGVEREFREENGIPADIKMYTDVIGFVRIIQNYQHCRGGVPDFLCVSYIDCKKEELESYKGKISEYRLSGEPIYKKVEMHIFGDEKEGISQNSVSSLIEKINSDIAIDFANNNTYGLNRPREIGPNDQRDDGDKRHGLSVQIIAFNEALKYYEDTGHINIFKNVIENYKKKYPLEEGKTTTD